MESEISVLYLLSAAYGGDLRIGAAGKVKLLLGECKNGHNAEEKVWENFYTGLWNG